jgi:hypothetical protein
MKRLLLLTLILCALTLLSQSSSAQETVSISTLREQIQKLEALAADKTLSEDARSLNRTFLAERRTQLKAQLHKRVEALRQYKASAASVLTGEELKAVDSSIQNLVVEMQHLGESIDGTHPSTAPLTLVLENTGVSDSLPAANTSKPERQTGTQTGTQAAQQTADQDAEDDDKNKDDGVLDRLAKHGFSLQRAVTGDNATEGASFSFLRTYGAGTVFASDFALIWTKQDPPIFGTRWRTLVRPQISLEGRLTSEESEAEDAWRLRGTVQFDTRFPTKRFYGMRNFFGVKVEADQKLNTKKVMFEYLVTPTATPLGIGVYLGHKKDEDAISFRWRPYFGLDAGHTYKRGEAELPEETILRLVPRLRVEFRLNFIDWMLKTHRTLLYADNTFYYLPLEDGARTPNYFVSGLEIGFNKNAGLGFKYKNGKSAPKFEMIHTFGGEFTFRFGGGAQ